MAVSQALHGLLQDHSADASQQYKRLRRIAILLYKEAKNKQKWFCFVALRGKAAEVAEFARAACNIFSKNIFCRKSMFLNFSVTDISLPLFTLLYITPCYLSLWKCYIETITCYCPCVAATRHILWETSTLLNTPINFRLTKSYPVS